MHTGNKDEGLTEAQKEALLKNISKQLQALDSSYNVEKQRQQLAMKQRLAGRKDMAEKARKLKEEIERKEASAATHFSSRNACSVHSSCPTSSFQSSWLVS